MYTYDIDVADMFEDRTQQFEKFGIPRHDIERVRTAATDMWADGPGGWAYEWSQLAQEYADRGEHHMASLLYGCLNLRHVNVGIAAAGHNRLRREGRLKRGDIADHKNKYSSWIFQLCFLLHICECSVQC